MHILQSGLPKSGNFWLHQIISNILNKAKLEEKSFIKKQPIYKVAQTWDMGVIGQININFLDILEKALFYRIGNIFRYPIDDIDDYINNCNAVWTHSQFCDKCGEIFPKFNKIIYIIRDPRDVAISYSNFIFGDYMRRYYPFFTFHDDNPQEYLNNHLTEIVADWINHVSGYLKHQNEFAIHIIFYERLLENFEQELHQLLNYLEIKISPQDIDDIKNKVDFNTMKQQSPNHLRKGKTAQWLEIFSPSQNQQVLNLAQPLLEVLNYPLKLKDEKSLPKLPNQLPQELISQEGKVSLLIPAPH